MAIEVNTNGLIVFATAAYNNSVTSVTVSVDASSPISTIPTLTAGQQMHFYWDGEIVTCTSCAGGTTNVVLTITRNSETTSTGAVSHLINSKLFNVATVAAATQTAQDGAAAYIAGNTIPAATITSLTVTPSATASYSNPGGTGDRHLLIQGYVNSQSVSGASSILVNGNLSDTTGWIDNGHGNQIFDFGLGIGNVKVTEATFYVITGGGSTFTWYGSNDNSTYTSLGTSATFPSTGGSYTQIDTTLASNTTFYRYYRINWNGGAGIQLGEVQFKLVASVAATPCLSVVGQASFTGNVDFSGAQNAPTSLTPATADNSTKIATTAFVDAYVASLEKGSGGKLATTTSATLTSGNLASINGSSDFIDSGVALGTTSLKTSDYTFVAADSGKSFVFNSANPINCYLPSAIPNANFVVSIANIGNGPLTVFTSGKNLDGSTTPLVIPIGMAMVVTTDNSNYLTDKGVVPTAINYQTTNYTAVPSDIGKLIVMNSSSPTTVTLPFPAPSRGWNIQVENIGTGVVTIAPNSLSNSWPVSFGGPSSAVNNAFVVNNTGLSVSVATLPSQSTYSWQLGQASSGNGWGVGLLSLKTAAGTAKVVQSASIAVANATNGSATLAFSSPVTAGNCIVAIYTANGAWNGFGTTYSCSDTLSSTFTKFCAGANNPNIFVSPNSAGGADTVTINIGGTGISGTSGQVLVIMELSGIATSSPGDATYSNQINGSGTITGISLAPTQAAEIAVLAVGVAQKNNAVVTSQLIDQATTNLTVNQNQGVSIMSDGFNYFSERGLGIQSITVPSGEFLATQTGATVAISKVNQNANTFAAGPSSGAAAAWAFRAITVADLPAITQNSQSASYTTVLADARKHIYHPSADTTARTWTINSNANVAYPIGTELTFVNDTSAGVITIAITADTLVLAGAGTTGSRTLAASGLAIALKVTATRWIIRGYGLT